MSYAVATPEHAELATRLLKRFHAEYPQIELEEITAAPAQLNAKVLLLALAGTPPDVMHITAAGEGGAADLAARGVLRPLDALIKLDRALNWQDFWPGLSEMGQFEGVQMALPSTGLTTALTFYNKELFTAAGRPTPDEHFKRGTWTWETLVEEASRLTKRSPRSDAIDGTGDLVQAGFGSPLEWDVSNWTLMLLRSYGADFRSVDGTKVVVDTPPAARALRVAHELGFRRRTIPGRDEGTTMDLVRAGKVAQAIYWSAASSWWRSMAMDWDVAPGPRGPARHATAATVGQLALSRHSIRQDAAWRYAVASLSPEADVERATSLGLVVLRQSTFPEWRQRLTAQKPKNLELVQEAARTIKFAPLQRPHPQAWGLDLLLQRQMGALLLDGRPPEQVANTLSVEGNRLLALK